MTMETQEDTCHYFFSTNKEFQQHNFITVDYSSKA